MYSEIDNRDALCISNHNRIATYIQDNGRASSERDYL